MRRRRTGSALIAALSVAGAASAAAEVELSASVDRAQAALDDTVALRITAVYSSKADPGELTLPEFSDFDVVSRAQSEQVSFAFVNGAPSFRRTLTTTLALTPRRAGDVVIEPARLAFHGKTYQTRELRLRVLPAGQASPGGQRPPDPTPAPDQARPDDPFADVHPGQRDLILRAVADVEKPFVGQQVTYSLYLLARINVSGIDKLQLPRLDGFWTEELEAPQQLLPEDRAIEGVPYRSYLLRRRALFALRPGRAVIEPAEVEVLTGFGMLFSRGSARRQSQALTLDVQPLPPGKPPGFDPGNVGQWTLSATAEPPVVAAGQPITYRLVASGRGNVRDLRMPRLGAIPGLRAYDATTSDKESVEKGQVTGARTVEQLLVPERTGPVEIPALAMDVFDPSSKQYRTLRTEPITVRVTPAAGGQASAPAVQNLLGAGGVRPIRLRFATVGKAPPPWTAQWFWPLLALPPFAVALVLGASRARRALQVDVETRRIRLARSSATRRLRGAKALLVKGDAAAFYAEIARAVSGYLADKQKLSTSGLTREELSQALLARGHPEEAVRRVVRVLDDCDRARFSPGTGEAREAMLGRADQAIAELEARS